MSIYAYAEFMRLYQQHLARTASSPEQLMKHELRRTVGAGAGPNRYPRGATPRIRDWARTVRKLAVSWSR